MASENAVVRARISERTKTVAEAVLKDLGLTVSDLIRMTLTRVAVDHAVPFDLKTPNAETRAAMEEARAIMKRGRGRTAEEVFGELEGKIESHTEKGRTAA